VSQASKAVPPQTPTAAGAVPVEPPLAPGTARLDDVDLDARQEARPVERR
jgi:hypothetical protein